MTDDRFHPKTVHRHYPAHQGQWELILRAFSATDDVEAIMAKLKIDKADLEDVYELCEAVRLAKRQLHGGERSS